MPSFPLCELCTDEAAICNEFENIFKDSVRLRMHSNVPVRAFLSSGLDSGSVVVAMGANKNERIRSAL